MRRCGELSNGQRLIEIALSITQYTLDTVGFGFQLRHSRKLRLATGTLVMTTRCLTTARATSIPRSCSIIASTRSIRGVIPADVHIGPSMMKTRSSSTLTFGNRARRARARSECVAVEQTCFGNDEGAGARRGNPPASPQSLPHKFD
jgi:hypothetical protein